MSSREAFRKVDKTLDLYHKQLKDSNYLNDDGIGIFLQHAMEQGLDENDFDFKQELDRGPVDCVYPMAWKNKRFPVPVNIKINSDQMSTFIYYIIHYCYTNNKPPSNDYIREHLMVKCQEIKQDLNPKASPFVPRRSFKKKKALVPIDENETDDYSNLKAKNDALKDKMKRKEAELQYKITELNRKLDQYQQIAAPLLSAPYILPQPVSCTVIPITTLPMNYGCSFLPVFVPNTFSFSQQPEASAVATTEPSISHPNNQQTSSNDPTPKDNHVTLSSSNTKKRKRRKTETPAIYEPNVNQSLGLILSKEITKAFPSRIAERIDNLHTWIRKMIPLQEHDVIINDKIWILDPQFSDKQTCEPLYCMADRIDENDKIDEKDEKDENDGNHKNDKRGSRWKFRDRLYLSKDVCDVTQIPSNTLPSTFINTTRYKKQMFHIADMEQILKDSDKREEIFNTKIGWQDVAIFKNKKAINKEQRKLGLRKPDFLQRCKVAANENNITLIPIICNKDKDGYCIDGLWLLTIGESVDIGISFKYNGSKKIMMPSGIHLDAEFMEFHCKLANPKKTAAIRKYFDNFKSIYNDLSIGNHRYWQNLCNQRTKELEKAENELEKFRLRDD